jgi:hypothetical protein
MVYAIDSDQKIDRIPHRQDYDRWRRGFSDEEYQAIYDQLKSRISGS